MKIKCHASFLQQHRVIKENRNAISTNQKRFNSRYLSHSYFVPSLTVPSSRNFWFSWLFIGKTAIELKTERHGVRERESEKE